MKLNQYGDTIWTKQYDLGAGSTFANVLSLTDSDIFVSGVYQTTPSSTDALVLKVDSSGNIKWQNTIGGAGSEIVLKADTLSSTRYLISGYKSFTSGGFTDAWMCLLDSTGTVITQKTFGYAYGDGGFATVMNADTILFHGSYETPPNPIDQNRVGFVILCDANLNFLDTLFIDLTPNSYINSIYGSVKNTRGEYVLMGNTYDFDINDPIGQLVCVNKNLDIQWYRTFKARENANYFTDISLMPDGGYIISGYVFSDDPGNTQDGWLVRTNCLGWLSKPIPQFTAFNTGNNTVRFHNYSKYAEKYLWDFGDGWQYSHATSLQDSLSSIPYVEHTYTTPGNYTATLYAIACGDTMTITQTIVADPVSVTETNKENIKIYPNPTGGNAFIESPTLANYHTLQVYNEAGQWVYSTTITAQATNRLEIPSSNWANGIYVVTLEGVERVEKVVLMKTE
jgi:PKD repeat protein